MKRSLTIRLFIGILVIAVSVMLFSYVHAKASSEEDPTCETGKCPSSGKSHTEFMLWESLVHTLLNARP
jgi:hypothetical protein